jgi:signal transduction histidine kinase/FixJ family two-component response regulator
MNVSNPTLKNAQMAETDKTPEVDVLAVLLVEDNPDDAFLLERHLRRNGVAVQVTRVETAEELVAELGRERPPDVLLADYNLPHFSGPAALQILKASGIDIPFIMMSGAVSEETAVESMRAGAQDYVTKQNLTRLVPALERELNEAVARRGRRAAEIALKASEARFHRLVEAMPVGLLISDASGTIVYANKAIERMLGYAARSESSKREGGTALQPVMLESICPELQQAAARAFQEGTVAPEAFEAVCRASDSRMEELARGSDGLSGGQSGGQSIEVLIGLALLNPAAPEEDRQVAAFIADLRPQKRSEEVLRQTEKLAVAGRLAASIAHEINNPLEAVTNCLYLLGQTELAAEPRGYLELAQGELDRVSQITVQTLRFYRQSTKAARLDVHELIGTVLALLEPRLVRYGIEIVREFRETPSVLVRDGEIRQVVANLVGNAIDALPESPEPAGRASRIVLRTSSGRSWKTGRRGIRLTVADNGTGMSAETERRIFEPFFSTKGMTGTGLGLWVSQEIVGKHSGRLQVRSRLGVGTVFSLFLPEEQE